MAKRLRIEARQFPGSQRLPSVGLYDLRESAYTFGLPHVPGSTAMAVFRLFPDGAEVTTDALLIGYDRGNMICHLLAGGTDVGRVNLPHQPDAMRYLRVGATGSEVYWESSTNGAAWVRRRTAPLPPWGIAALRAEYMAASFDAVSAGTYAEFDAAPVGAVNPERGPLVVQAPVVAFSKPPLTLRLASVSGGNVLLSAASVDKSAGTLTAPFPTLTAPVLTASVSGAVAAQAVPAGGPAVPSPLPTRVVQGYLQSWSPLRLSAVPAGWNVVTYAFALGVAGDPGALRLPTGANTVATLAADNDLLRSQGRRSLLSIGGWYDMGSTIGYELRTTAHVDRLMATLVPILDSARFHGIDWDLEHPENATAAAMVDATNRLLARYGPDFIIGAVPFGTPSQPIVTLYRDLAQALGDDLDLLTFQFYNRGPETVTTVTDWAASYIAACGLRDDQFAFGFAMTDATPESLATVAHINNVWNTWRGRGREARGIMHWSINTDVANGNAFVSGPGATVRATPPPASASGGASAVWTWTNAVQGGAGVLAELAMPASALASGNRQTWTTGETPTAPGLSGSLGTATTEGLLVGAFGMDTGPTTGGHPWPTDGAWEVLGSRADLPTSGDAVAGGVAISLAVRRIRVGDDMAVRADWAGKVDQAWLTLAFLPVPLAELGGVR
jgi:chitinase